MGFSTFLSVIFLTVPGADTASTEIDAQAAIYAKWWQTDLVRKLDDLPTEGSVSDDRVPYSGHIYPDNAGGTTRALRKYDAAFHAGRLRATAHEEWDTHAYQREIMAPQRVGLLGLRTRMRPTIGTPAWHGHCNGWTAAAIRHAEPQVSVVRNGVTFSPADIKALLADIYMYSHYEALAGENSSVRAGTLHLILANWLGRQSHPLGMEAHPGREKWNFPIYAYTSSLSHRRGSSVDVETRIRYAYYSNGEYNRSPRIERQKYFRYTLTLDGQGNIIGGQYYRDSSVIDLLWVPRAPVPGGSPGNEDGNPHIDVAQVLSIWRDSVPRDIADKWRNIDASPAAES